MAKFTKDEVKDMRKQMLGQMEQTACVQFLEGYNQELKLLTSIVKAMNQEVKG